MNSSLRSLENQFPDLKKFLIQVNELVGSGFFSRDCDILINRTPGRLDLMGGNDDYTGGLVFEKTIREATLVAVQPRSDDVVELYNPSVTAFDWQERVTFHLADLREGDHLAPIEKVRTWINTAPRSSWAAYLVGDLYYLMEHFPEKVTAGFSLYLESDVPLGKGVSSSAALEVAVMKATAARYDIEVSGVELASWTQWVEIALTQSACGIMDQLAVVMGDENCFVPMLCQPCLPYPLAKLPENLYVWGIDSDVRHAVSGIEYEAARAATFMGYRYLCEWEHLQSTLDKSGALPRWVEPKWNGYLANLSPSLFRSLYEQRLPEFQLGSQFNQQFGNHLDPFTPVRPVVSYPLRGATRYAVEENWRVHAFFNLISKTTLDEETCHLLGELMYLSHRGYSECGLGSQQTDRIVQLVRAEESHGLYGAKITGGGAGGTVAVLGENSTRARAAFRRVAERYAAENGKQPYIFEGSSAGCDVFGVQTLNIA